MTNEFSWIENWGPLGIEKGWSHHGLVVSENDLIITGRADQRELLFLDQDGALIKSFSVDVIDTHGIAISKESEREVLWISDAGKRRDVGGSFDYPGFYEGKVLKTDLNGKTLAVLDRTHLPDLPENVRFSPTVSAVNPFNEDLWITDGYGSHRIYRFDSNLAYLGSIDGSLGAGRFKEPHWINFDLRFDSPRLTVADRRSHRLQVFDAEGNFLHSLGENELNTPSVIAFHQDLMYVGELEARVVVFDSDQNIVSILGDGHPHAQKPGWPNRLDANGQPIRPDDLKPGVFNSPHGLDLDSQGNLYVAEWLIGGRLSKLKKA